jgi:Spy/CpxP family protein refolding chaperone
MKIWISLFFAAVFAGGTCLGVALDRNFLAHAQEAPRSHGSHSSWGQPAEMSVTKFATALELTEEQNSELDRILGDANRDIDAFRRAQRASTDRAREQVTAILTEAQRKKLDELVATERARRTEAEIDRSMKLYTSHLALTEAQSGPVRQLLVENRKQRSDYFKRGDKTQMKEFFRTQRAELEKKLEGILSPDQMKKYRDIGEWF